MKKNQKKKILMKPALFYSVHSSIGAMLQDIYGKSSDFLHSPQGFSSKCKHPRCKASPCILETYTIKNTRNKEIALIGNYNWKTKIVYGITCENCDQIYVG